MQSQRNSCVLIAECLIQEQLIMKDAIVGLASNTRHFPWLAPSPESVESVAIEYHLLSWRELYDKSILTADRYSSGAARWVIRGQKHFYTVEVVSRPYYSLPQELCLSFDCYAQVTEKESGGHHITQHW